jgi:hypothetical protein
MNFFKTIPICIGVLFNFSALASNINIDNCLVNPEDQYQILMKKASLAPQEQFELIELEKTLSHIVLLGSTDAPKCIKNGVWKIDLKAIEKRMSSYRRTSDGFAWIDWQSYKNPKISLNSAAYIMETLSFLGDESAPTHIIVPGQNNCEGCDSVAPTKTETEFANSLKESCTKYSDKIVREHIRKRTLASLKEMDSYGVNTEDDREPTEQQKKQIFRNRKKIRSNITDVLNKHCS